MNRITRCPHCSARFDVSEGITEKTSICPHCRAEVGNVQLENQFLIADINTDVRHNWSVGCTVITALIGLCFFSIVLTFSIPLDGEGEIARAIFAAYLFVVLDVLVSIAIMYGLIRWGLSGVRNPPAGRYLGIALLLFGTIVAVCVFFYFTCADLLDSRAR